jgi:hypothetical protein
MCQCEKLESLFGSGYGLFENPCEHGIELPGFIRHDVSRIYFSSVKLWGRPRTIKQIQVVSRFRYFTFLQGIKFLRKT